MPPLSAAHKPSSTNEISRYGTLIAWAEELGHDNVLPLLNANLKEEKAADRKLNTLAKRGVNRRASGTSDARAPRRTAVARSTVNCRTGTTKKSKPRANKH